MCLVTCAPPAAAKGHGSIFCPCKSRVVNPFERKSGAFQLICSGALARIAKKFIACHEQTAAVGHTSHGYMCSSALDAKSILPVTGTTSTLHAIPRVSLCFASCWVRPRWRTARSYCKIPLPAKMGNSKHDSCMIPSLQDKARLLSESNFAKKRTAKGGKGASYCLRYFFFFF